MLWKFYLKQVGFFELLPDRKTKAGSLKWWEVVAGPRKNGGAWLGTRGLDQAANRILNSKVKACFPEGVRDLYNNQNWFAQNLRGLDGPTFKDWE